MFGYVRIAKPTLTCGDYERYRGVYCALCRTLGRRYSPLAKNTLSYDAAFYALVALALQDEPPALEAFRCPMHPLRRRVCVGVRSSVLQTAADISILMSYGIWMDHRQDGKWYRRVLLAFLFPFFAIANHKAIKKNPQAAYIIRTASQAQRLVESSSQPCFDQAAHPSAHALGALFALLSADGEQQTRLNAFGYFLGRWVYAVDAADDFEKDRRRGNFNPFTARDAVMGEVLSATWEALVDAYEQLDLRRYKAILNNILLEGMPACAANVLQAPKTRKANRKGVFV
ncbi:MAG: DUF5685 family protein [Oscillospiraceae bacterium]|nr:DUF5685 family protein [Oscillospiraceae bacterium]